MQPVRFQTSEAYIHAIVGGTPDALVAVDSQGRMVAVNRAAETLFDLPASAMLGYPISESRLPEFGLLPLLIRPLWETNSGAGR